MIEAAWHQRIENAFTCVPKRRVPEIVPKGDGLCQFLMQMQHLGDGARNLRDLECVREARAVVVSMP